MRKGVAESTAKVSTDRVARRKYLRCEQHRMRELDDGRESECVNQRVRQTEREREREREREKQKSEVAERGSCLKPWPSHWIRPSPLWARQRPGGQGPAIPALQRRTLSTMALARVKRDMDDWDE